MRSSCIFFAIPALIGLVGCGEGPKTFTEEKTFTNGVGQKLIWVAPGSFRMGDLSGSGSGDELPVRTVELSGYHLGATEVTQEQWQAVMGSEVPDPSHFKGAELPVEQVDWLAATEFCRRLTQSERAAGLLPEGYSYVLPTEAQWENACRAGTEEDYAGNLEELAWHGENAEGSSHPVAQAKPNAWGFFDMHGNVWEWCRDGVRSSYEGLGTRDPIGQGKSAARVLRGGSWDSQASLCRSSNRLWSQRSSRDNDLGFRIAVGPVAGGGS